MEQEEYNFKVETNTNIKPGVLIIQSVQSYSSHPSSSSRSILTDSDNELKQSMLLELNEEKLLFQNQSQNLQSYWQELRKGFSNLRTDHCISFFIPNNKRTKRTVIQGLLEKINISPEIIPKIINKSKLIREKSQESRRASSLLQKNLLVKFQSTSQSRRPPLNK